MTLRTVTATTKDTAGEPDNTEWVFCSELRGADGEIITTRPKTVKPAAGQLTVQLEPGPTIVMYGGRKLTILVPDEDADLWELLEAAIAYPPDTSQQQLNTAVGQYVEANRQQFRTRAVPVDPDDPDTLYQWVDSNGDDVGDPVELVDIINVGWGAIAGKPAVMAVGADAAEARAAIGESRICVSWFITSGGTYKDAIEAAIAAAGALTNGIVDFEGVEYVTEATVTVDDSVTLVNGGIVPTGNFRALSVTAADVTVRNMTFSRSTSYGYSDSLQLRSCVSVSGERFTSIDCSYLASAHSCVYLEHAACDGAVIRGGEMTGTAVTQDAAGVYAANGSTGNRHITVDGVYIHDTTDGVLLFDSSDCTVRNNRVESLRILPTRTVTGWTNVSGNVWRARSATGTNPGVDGPLTDRPDGNSGRIKVDGTQLGAIVLYSTAPTANQCALGNDGWLYINLNGTDPNTKTITSDTASGYAYTAYGTVGGAQCQRNRFVNNYAEDCDGFGLYFQLSHNDAEKGGNVAIGNVLRNVCLSGIQNTTLPFAGLAVTGGCDTLVMGNLVDGVGSSGNNVPGIYYTPSGESPYPSGRSIGNTVRHSYGDGFRVRASVWTLTGDEAHNNTYNGIRVDPWTSSDTKNVVLVGCIASYNALAGIVFDGSTSSSYVVSARAVGGSTFNNTQNGVLVYGTATSTCADCGVIGVASRGNGGSGFAQIRVRNAALRTTVDDCHMMSATSGAIGLLVDTEAVDTVVGVNQYSLTTPETINALVRSGGYGAAAVWRGSGSPEGAVTAPVGAEYRRTDGGAETARYVKESGTGNTGWVAVATNPSSSATADTVALRTANGNLKADAFIPSYDSTVTAAGTTTLTLNSAQVQVFTGSTTQTMLLPTTGVTAGQTYTVINLSSGTVTVQSSDATSIIALTSGRCVTLIARIDTPTTGTDWNMIGATASTAAVGPTLAMRDASANLYADLFIPSRTSTATNAGTTTLTVSADTQTQVFTGSTTHTVKLPTTSVLAGMTYNIVNNSSGTVTVQSSGANTITTVAGGASASFMAQVDAPTTAANWRYLAWS